MKKVFEKFIRQCNEDFVEEYPMDAVEMIKDRYERGLK